MMQHNPELNMDIGHIFTLTINGVRHRDTTVYNDREFTMILDRYSGYLPCNVSACHFDAKKGPHPVFYTNPAISLPIYELTRPKSSVPDGLRLYCRRGPRSGVPVLRRYFDFIWTEHEDNPGGLLAFVDGKEYSFLSEYEARPTNLVRACEYINRMHRHNVAPQGHKFSIELTSLGFRVGVLIASEPKARHLNDGYTLELNRCCADERYHNVCSALNGKAVRMGKEMGYRRFISYTLTTESGASLMGSGFRKDGIVKGKKEGWSSKSRPRKMPERYPTGDKQRWVLHVKKEWQAAAA